APCPFVVPIGSKMISPLFFIPNLVNPDEDAVNISPSPELSTTTPAKAFVCAEKEATGMVFDKVDAPTVRASKIARGEVVLTPTRPVVERYSRTYGLPIPPAWRVIGPARFEISRTFAIPLPTEVLFDPFREMFTAFESVLFPKISLE